MMKVVALTSKIYNQTIYVLQKRRKKSGWRGRVGGEKGGWEGGGGGGRGWDRGRRLQ